MGSPCKTMGVNNFNKLPIIAFATFARKWDFSPAKTLRNKAGLKPHFLIVTVQSNDFNQLHIMVAIST